MTTSKTISEKSSNNDNNDNRRSSSMYVAIPTILEGKLLKLLDITPYSTSVKTVKINQGGVIDGDDIKRRIDPLEKYIIKRKSVVY